MPGGTTAKTTKNFSSTLQQVTITFGLCTCVLVKISFTSTIYPITSAKSKGKIKWSLIQELVAAMAHICSK
jgi:hypothetical protein